MAHGPGIGRTIQNKPYIVTGTATVTSTPVDLTLNGDGRTHTNYFTVQNTGGTNLLQFSFDNVKFATVFAGASFQLNAKVFTVWIKTLSATTTYEFVCTADRS